MNSSRLKNEGWFYWLAFLIALGFRLTQLGASPLTDFRSQPRTPSPAHRTGSRPSAQLSTPLYSPHQYFLPRYRKHELYGALHPCTRGQRACLCSLVLPRKDQTPPRADPCLLLRIRPGTRRPLASIQRDHPRSNFPPVRLGDVGEWTLHPRRHLCRACASLWILDLVRFADADSYLDIFTRYGSKTKQYHLHLHKTRYVLRSSRSLPLSFSLVRASSPPPTDSAPGYPQYPPI